jgi:hypothetical protein
MGLKCLDHSTCLAVNKVPLYAICTPAVSVFNATEPAASVCATPAVCAFVIVTARPHRVRATGSKGRPWSSIDDVESSANSIASQSLGV